MITVLAVKVDGTMDESLYQELLRKVSTERQEKAIRFRHRIDAIRSVVGERLIRYWVKQKTSIPDSMIELGRAEFGKPELIHPAGLQVNVSHSGSWVVCAGGYQALGIDVEKIQPIDLDIAKHYFTDKESRYIFTSQGDQRYEAFYTLWTAKESYLKAVGKGLGIPLDSFHIEVDTRNHQIYLHAPNDPVSYDMKMIELAQEYKLALCVAGKLKGIQLSRLQPDQLI